MTRPEFIVFVMGDPRVDLDGGKFLEFRGEHPGFESSPELAFWLLWEIRQDDVHVEVRCRDERQEEWYSDTRHTMSFAAAKEYIEQLPKPFTAWAKEV